MEHKQKQVNNNKRVIIGSNIIGVADDDDSNDIKYKSINWLVNKFLIDKDTKQQDGHKGNCK